MKTEAKQNNDTDKLKLPDGVTLASLSNNHSVAASEYSRAFRKAVKLDATDKGRMWEAVGAKFPSYQVLPDTNHISYVKNNILASLYTVGKSAALQATSKEDNEIITNLNIALENIWDTLNVSWYQMQAGERAALLNLGITQVGWNNNTITPDAIGKNKGACALKNVNPLKYMRDPFADTLETAEYVMIWDDYHKSVIESNPNYKATFKSYLAARTAGAISQVTASQISDKISSNASSRMDYFRVFTHWIRQGEEIHEIHTINNEYVLFVKQNIKPSKFPFAELYCNLPSGDLFGTSEPAKIFSNTVAYNIMQSTLLTSEYKNQRPPRFISKQSMLNVASFLKHGNDADRAFVVNGDASKAVHYHQFPQPTTTAVTAMALLARDVQQVTGVDGKYTGRDTGSILTTGGIDSMLDQVTMIDAPKVLCYESYCKRLTELILSNYITNSAIKRNYFVSDPKTRQYKTITVDFPELDNDTVFSYSINISSELPKNKSRIENMANKLMQMQMQYAAAGIDVDIIQPEEWLQYLDLPMKEMFLERMKIQRTANWTEMVAQVIQQYTGLIQSGADPNTAVQATAETLRAQNTPDGMKNLEENLASLQQ